MTGAVLKEMAKYANRLISDLDKHNKTMDDPNYDKHIKKISVPVVEIHAHTGPYGSSSVYDSFAKPNHAFYKAVSNYLTENFDEVIIYASNNIKDQLKPNIAEVKRELQELTELVKELS